MQRHTLSGRRVGIVHIQFGNLIVTNLERVFPVSVSLFFGGHVAHKKWGNRNGGNLKPFAFPIQGCPLDPNALINDGSLLPTNILKLNGTLPHAIIPTNPKMMNAMPKSVLSVLDTLDLTRMKTIFPIKATVAPTAEVHILNLSEVPVESSALILSVQHQGTLEVRNAGSVTLFPNSSTRTTRN